VMASPTECVLVDFDSEGEDKILAAALYALADLPLGSASGGCRRSPAGPRRIAEHLLGKLGSHDVPLRELEHSSYTFDLTMDEGAYAEFKRHRMMTQSPQMLSANLGYSVPRLIVDAGLGAA